MGTTHSVTSTTLADMAGATRDGMFRLRYDTFYTRLGWAVTTHDGMERDQFDHAGTSYIIAQSPTTGVDACWRLLPTTGPNMVRDTFPELLHGQPAPAAADIWELSRFAIATDRVDTSAGAFGPLTVALMAESARFALQHGISRYITVTTVAMERLMKRQGLNVHRVGPPIRIGIALAVACIIEVDDITLSAVGMSPAEL